MVGWYLKKTCLWKNKKMTVFLSLLSSSLYPNPFNLGCCFVLLLTLSLRRASEHQHIGLSSSLQLSQVCKVVAIETTRVLGIGEDGSDPCLSCRKEYLLEDAGWRGLRETLGNPKRRGLEVRLLLAVHGGETEIPCLEMYPFRSVQPVARRPHAAQGGYECGPTQNHKFT